MERAGWRTIRRVLRWHLPPRVEMLIRAAQTRGNLKGFYAPGRELSALVPAGKLAVDAGANVGIYSYWMSKSASEVVAFEPQPMLAKRLGDARIQNVRSYNIALSDINGFADLHIPQAHGEASLNNLRTTVETIRVPLRTLDSFGFADLGFLKIDVEGHEEALLRGAEETLNRSNASVYVEVEERHNPGGLSRIIEWMGEIGYTKVQYRQNGEMHPIDKFDLGRDQLGLDPLTPEYANNFLFRRGN